VPETDDGQSADAGSAETRAEPESVSWSRWIKGATPHIEFWTKTVLLVGAIVGIWVSVYSLLQKSEADRDAARTNLEIAKQNAASSLKVAEEKSSSDAKIAEINRKIAESQLVAHEKEYKFQGDQQQKQQVAAAITDLFRTSEASEGRIAVLSNYVKSDHRYDELIVNAVLAKLGTTRTASETDLSFSVLEKIGPHPRLEALIRFNQRARAQYDAALIELAWSKLDEQTAEWFHDRPLPPPTAMDEFALNQYALDAFLAVTSNDVAELAASQLRQANVYYANATIYPSPVGSTSSPAKAPSPVRTTSSTRPQPPPTASSPSCPEPKRGEGPADRRPLVPYSLTPVP